MIRQLNEQKFCGWCGAEVTYTSEWTSECASCGYKNYLNPNPCSNILVLRDDSVLIVRRAVKPQLGKYDLPGGYMDIPDTSMEACIYRELEEEVGLRHTDVTPPRYLGSIKAPDYIWQDTAIKNVSFYYVVELRDKNTIINTADGENSEVCWVTKDKLPDIDFAWDIDKEMLFKFFNGD